MKARSFIEIPAYEDVLNAKFEKGDKFLTGTNLIAQKELKQIGEMVTYYIVTDVSSEGKNISYKPVYEKLEE